MCCLPQKISSVQLIMLLNLNSYLIYIFHLCSGSAVEGGVVKLNNAAHFENCTFMRNSATEYGAAISLASLLFLVDSSNVQPLSITDW